MNAHVKVTGNTCQFSTIDRNRFVLRLTLYIHTEMRLYRCNKQPINVCHIFICHPWTRFQRKNVFLAINQAWCMSMRTLHLLCKYVRWEYHFSHCKSTVWPNDENRNDLLIKILFYQFQFVFSSFYRLHSFGGLYNIRLNARRTSQEMHEMKKRETRKHFIKRFLLS